jgi:DNA repair protein RadD
MRLRDYQRDALRHIRRRIKDGDRRMYVSLPTGTGKTMILARLVAKALARGDRVAWVVHLRELVTQAARMLEDATGEEPGIVMADRRDVGADLVVGSVQSLEKRRLDETLEAGAFDLLVVDEAHHVTRENRYARLIQEIESRSDDLVVVGATATPYRHDKSRMQDVLDVCAFERSIEDMQDAGWLCPLEWRPVQLDGLDLKRISTGIVQGERDFVQRDLSAQMSKVVNAVVAATVDSLEDRLTLAFAVDVEHAHQLADAYRKAGLKAEAVSGTTPYAERAKILNAWRRGKIDVVTNCMVLGEGFDLPRIDALVLARPTMSVGLYVQQLGRGTRPVDGKDNCLVFDFTGLGLKDARQVVFADVVGVEDGAERNGRPRRLLDPGGRARWAWGSAGDVYYASVGVKVSAALVPEQGGSGLYDAYVVGENVRRIDRPPVPLRDALVVVEQSLSIFDGVIHRLANQNEPWRTEPPSDKQMRYLARISPKKARRAVREGWTKGDVATAITGKHTIRRLRAEGVLT